MKILSLLVLLMAFGCMGDRDGKEKETIYNFPADKMGEPALPVNGSYSGYSCYCHKDDCKSCPPGCDIKIINTVSTKSDCDEDECKKKCEECGKDDGGTPIIIVSQTQTQEQKSDNTNDVDSENQNTNDNAIEWEFKADVQIEKRWYKCYKPCKTWGCKWPCKYQCERRLATDHLGNQLECFMQPGQL